MGIIDMYQMNHGSARSLSWFEKSALKKAGRLDGSIGLPKKDDNGIWTSAFVESEIHSCQEKCDKLWGSLQIKMKKNYAEMDTLVDIIAKKHQKICQLQEEISFSNDSSTLKTVKAGEEGLSESIIIGRRSKEKAIKTQPMRAEIQKLNEEIDSLYKRLTKLKGICKEASNSTKINTQRIEEHTGQRINAYWNAAYEKQSDKGMPPTCKVIINCAGETYYYQSHQNIDERIMLLLSENN